MATVRELITKLGFEIDSKPLNRLDEQINGIKNNLSSMVRLGKVLALGIFGQTAGIGFFLKQAGEFEQVQIAFETMLQSADEAKKLLESLTQFAQKTPFRLVELQESTKRLLAFGVTAEKIIPTLTALGNIAAGVGIDKLPRLITAFGQVATAGKLRGQEVLQFTEAGVPILETVAKQLGVSREQIQGLVEAGKVSFSDVDKALQELANGSGRFTGLIAKQSKSFLGILSNIADVLQVLAVSIGQAILPEAKDLASAFFDFLTINKQLIKSNVSSFLMMLFDALKSVARVLLATGRILKIVAKPFGGLQKAVISLINALMVLFALRAVFFFGQIIQAGISAIGVIYQAAKALTVARAAILATNAAALALPLLLAGIAAAIFLIVDDIISFLRGEKSFLGYLLNHKDEILAKIKKFFGDVFDSAISMVESLKPRIEAVLENFFGFSPQAAQEIAENFQAVILSVISAIREAIELTIKGLIILKDAFIALFGTIGQLIERPFSKTKEILDSILEGMKEFAIGIGLTNSPLFPNQQMPLDRFNDEFFKKKNDTSLISPRLAPTTSSVTSNSNFSPSINVTVESNDLTNGTKLGEEISDTIHKKLTETFGHAERTFQPQFK